MAKDPAFLFYPGDWLGGTMGMTFEIKGAYLELLIFQFNCGKFTEAQAKQVLSTCSTNAWDMLKPKFKSDGEQYWNARLLEEVEKRKAFSESRRNNASGSKKKQSDNNTSGAYAQHMEDENKIVIRNESKNDREHLFKDSEYFDMDKFKTTFIGSKYEMFNLEVYYEKCKNWSANNKKKIDWIATARNMMLRDYTDGKPVYAKGLKKDESKIGKIMAEKDEVYQGIVKSLTK